MSGILGLLDRGGAPADPATLEAMVSRMAFWGPHGVGVRRDGPLALAFLKGPAAPGSPGDEQPRRDAAGGLVIVADARLDNRAELLEALRIPDGLRASTTDDELILAAFRRWGDDSPTHLVGDFVYAVWDEKARRLFCARDHYGTRPLFYRESPEVFAFASAIKALWALPGISRDVDEVAIADYLVDLRAPGDGTFYRDVRRLPAGHRLSVEAGRLDVSPYWRLEELPAIRLRSDEEYREAFEEVFDRAVRDRCRDARPVGVMLSGGLDSSAVAAVAARHLAECGARLQGIHSVPEPGAIFPQPPGWVADEDRYLEALRSQHPNLDIHRDAAVGRTPLSDLEGSFWRHDRPTRAVNNRYWIESLLEVARDRGIGVLLTGQFGNVTLSWRGAGALAGLALQGRWIALAGELHSLHRRGRSSLWQAVRSELVAPLLPFRVRAIYERMRGRGDRWARYSVIHPEFARRMRLDDLFRRRGKDPLFHTLPDSRAQRRRYLAEETGEVWASSSAAYGLEVADPTADKRLIEFCMSIPDDQFYRLGESRRLVRNAFHDTIPAVIRQRRDRGLQGADRFARLGDPVAALDGELERVSRAACVRPYLDIGLMKRRLREAAAPSAEDGHQEALSQVLKGIVLARFLIWNDSGGPPGG